MMLCFLTVSLDILFCHARGCGIQRILGVACTEFGGLASAPQPVSLAHLDDSIWLCDLIHQAPSQVQGNPLYIDNRQRCPCPMCRDCSALGKVCNRACPSSQDEIRVLQPIFHHTQEDSTKISVQRPPLWAPPVSPQLHKSHGRCPFFTTGV